MNRNFVMVGLALACGCLLGCGKGNQAELAQGPVKVYEVSESVVLAQVGEKKITVGDFRKRLAFEVGLYTYSMRHSSHPPKDKDAEKKLANFTKQHEQRVLPQLIHCALLDNYLKGSCGGTEVEGGEELVNKAFKRFVPKAKRGEGLEAFTKEIGLTPEYFKSQIEIEMKEKKARLAFDPASTNVTEKEIDEGLARLDAYTERAAASNRVIWASCSNLLARAKGGADFVALGKEIGNFNGEEEEWGTFSRSELEHEPLRQWAFKAKIGDIGGPFDMDEGLSIVKVLGHTAGTEEASAVSQGVEEVRLARITYPMIEEHPEPRTRPHVRQALLDWKKKGAQRRLVEKLTQEIKIEYPHGDKFDFTKEAK